MHCSNTVDGLLPTQHPCCRVEEPGEGESSTAAEMQSQNPMLALMPTLRNLVRTSDFVLNQRLVATC